MIVDTRIEKRKNTPNTVYSSRFTLPFFIILCCVMVMNKNGVESVLVFSLLLLNVLLMGYISVLR